MNDLVVFGGIGMLFFAWLLVKSLTKSQGLCAICAAVSTSWLVLLGLRFFKLYENELLLAILLGASATGGYYWLSRHRRLGIFKFPIFLSLVIGVYLIARWQIDLGLLLLAGATWLLFWFFSFGSLNKGFLKKVIECCKNW